MQDLLAGARGELRYEPIERRVRALGDETVVDSTRAMLVWEPRRVVPSYAVPAADIRAALAPRRADDGDASPACSTRASRSPCTPPRASRSRSATASGAGFRLADDDLDGYVVLDFAAFDEWYEEDERDRTATRATRSIASTSAAPSRPVRIELDGEVLAETTRARMLFETSLRRASTCPREDVRAELQPERAAHLLPVQGRGVVLVGRRGGARRTSRWSYEQPLPGRRRVAGLVAFWDERVDVFFDGERRARPGGAIADALRDEFRV